MASSEMTFPSGVGREVGKRGEVVNDENGGHYRSGADGDRFGRLPGRADRSCPFQDSFDESDAYIQPLSSRLTIAARPLRQAGASLRHGM